jgi:hypothetical protein
MQMKCFKCFGLGLWLAAELARGAAAIPPERPVPGATNLAGTGAELELVPAAKAEPLNFYRIAVEAP